MSRASAKRASVLIAVGVAIAAVVTIIALGIGREPDAPTPPPAPPSPTASDDLDATDGAPDATAEVPDAGGAKQLLGEVVESWPEPDAFDLDPAAPISDEAWEANPCKPLAEMIVGATPATPEEISAQIATARAHHPRNHMLDQETWTYASCLAVKKNDLAPCHETAGVTMPQRCEDNLLVYRLALATDAAQCEKDVAGFIESKRDRLLMRQICRAAAGDKGVCESFRQPEYRWYCQLLATPELSECASIKDPETREECPNLAILLRTVRKLPPLPDVEIDPETPLAVSMWAATDPDFDCAAWYRSALRAQCR
ncbi:MAG: hypothetical protein EP329_25400 [Deltaproteobacteria bacterium]|nr:MAG: hypothetical protein EP329_25400 [Deltaproteobacteria bacterium]